MPASEKKVSLLKWGPAALYEWLFKEWGNPDRLSEYSRNAIRLLYTYPIDDEVKLRHLVTSIKYEKVIMALTINDFGFFVGDVFESQILGFSPDDLGMSLVEFRQLLAKKFQDTILQPVQGFTDLLNDAVNGAAKAAERLSEVEPAVNLLHRRRAIESMHEGIDRALVCAERFMELLLEFLAKLCSVTDASGTEEVEEWLRIAKGEPDARNHFPTWGTKELEVHNAAKALKEYRTRLDREHIESDILSFSSACIGYPWGKKLDDLSHQERPIQYPGDAGDIMQAIEELRKQRNTVRHASSSLQSSTDVPEAYREAIKGVHKWLQKLQGNFETNISVPAFTKVLSITENCFGGLELHLAIEGRKEVTARYSTWETFTLGVAKEPLQLLALPQEPHRDKEYQQDKEFDSPEFFLFPSPRKNQNLIMNPLLIERATGMEKITTISLHPPAEISEEISEIIEF